MAKRVSGRAPLEKAELSLEEFTALPAEEGYRVELSRGRLVREPAPGPRHGQVAYALVDLLRRFGKEKGLGLIFFDVGFVLATDPPIVRVPDVAFVASDRVPEEGFTDRPWEMAPDLAVEVVSPSNRASEMQEKALDYLDAGAGLVWVVDPSQRTVTVYRSPRDIRILREGDLLEGGEVLPDLRTPVGELFE